MPKIKKDENKIISERLGETTPEERPITKIETKEAIELKEGLREKVVVEEELKRKIESMDFDEKLKQQAQAQAQQINNLQDEEKIKQLLQIAKQKGVVYAVNVAKKMNDAYILDKLHDILAEEGYYKSFLK